MYIIVQFCACCSVTIPLVPGGYQACVFWVRVILAQSGLIYTSERSFGC